MGVFVIMRQEPRMWRILKSDYLSRVLGTASLVLWALYLASAFGFLHRTGGTIYLLFAGVVTAISVPLFFVRLQRIKHLFANGILIKGEIERVQFLKGASRVEYKFSFGSQEIKTGAAVNKTATVKQLRAGQQVELVVDPQNPKRSFIVDLYCGIKPRQR